MENNQESQFNTLAEFNAYGKNGLTGAAAYGVGSVWIAGAQYWSDGADVRLSDGVSSSYAKKKICFIGDSLTAGMSGTDFGPPNKIPSFVQNYGGATIVSNLNGTFSNLFRSAVYFGLPKSTVGHSFTWNNTTKSLQFQAAGDTLGASVTISNAGFYTVYSGNGTSGVYFSALSSPNYTSGVYTFDTSTDAQAKRGVNFKSYASQYCFLNNYDSFSKIYNLGISGDTPAGVLSRISDVYSCNADINVLMIGINDTTQITEAKSCIDYLIGLKKPLILILPIPATNYTIIKYNSELYRYCKNTYPGQVSIVDATEWMYASNGTSVDSDKYSEAAASSLHPNAWGAYVIAKQMPVDLRIGQSSKVPTAADAYNSSSNPGGNLLTNGAGIGSVAQSTNGWTGNLPTSWTNGRIGSSITAVASKVDYTDGRKGAYTSIALSNGNGSDQTYVTLSGSSTLAVGDVIFPSALVQVKNATGLQRIFLEVKDGTPNFKVEILLNPYESGGTTQTAAFDMGSDWVLLRALEPIKIPSGSSVNLTANLFFQLATGGSATVNVAWIDVRKIVSA